MKENYQQGGREMKGKEFQKMKIHETLFAAIQEALQEGEENFYVFFKHAKTEEQEARENNMSVEEYRKWPFNLTQAYRLEGQRKKEGYCWMGSPETLKTYEGEVKPRGKESDIRAIIMNYPADKYDPEIQKRLKDPNLYVS